MKQLKNYSTFTRALFSCLFVFCFSFSYASEAISLENEKDNYLPLLPSCTGITILGGENKITVSGYGSGLSQIMVLNNSTNNSVEYSCSYSCDPNYKEISSLSEGGYTVIVTLYDTGWSDSCETVAQVEVLDPASPNCPNITVQTPPQTPSGQLKISGHADGGATPHIKVMNVNANYYVVYECASWLTPCSSSDITISGLGGGVYQVNINYANTSCNYSVQHTIPTYRIQSNNFGDEILVSNTPKTAVGNHTLSDFTIMPNPARDNLTVALESELEKQQVLRVYNMQGAVVLQKEVALNKGANQVEFDIANLPSGTYTLIPIGERISGNATRFLKL